MHSTIRQNNESAGKYPQADNVGPERLSIEAEGAQDGSSRDRNIETIFPVRERQICNFVDNERFEPVVEDR